MEFDLVKYIDEGYSFQQKYAEMLGQLGPIDLLCENGEKEDYSSLRNQKIIEYFGHLIEESVEARMHIPRRSWKRSEKSYRDSAEARKEFITEMYDILLFYRAILVYAGVTGEEFVKVSNEKHAFNLVRPDSNISQ